MTSYRVLYVINGFNKGGAEIGLRTMLEHGFLRGCELRVVALHQGSADLRAAIEGLVGPGNLTVVSQKPNLTLPALWAGLQVLRRTIRTFRPRAVVLSLRQANILGRVALLDRRSIRCIAFEHIAKLESGRLTPLYAALLRLLSPRVDEVWADCRVTLEGARRYYSGGRRRERVVPLFVADPDVRLKPTYALGDRIRLVTAGRLIPRKRVDVLLEALVRLRNQGHDCVLTVFGDGPERAGLERLAARLGIAEAVAFAGFRPAWHRAGRDHDIFVHLSDEEGFCIVAAEAMMVGLPVIASPVGGVLEYARDGENAVYAPTPEPDAVAMLISDMIASETRRRRLGRAAADGIAASYGTASTVAVYEALTRTFVRAPAEPVAADLIEGQHGPI